MKNIILKALVVAAEVTGSKLSEAAFAVMTKKLEKYPQGRALAAIDKAMETVEFKLTLASIVKHIGIGADQAWAHVPKTETEGAYLNQRMMKSLGVAQPLIDNGDMIAARRAFIEEYNAVGEDGDWWYSEPTGPIGHDDRVDRQAHAADLVIARDWASGTQSDAARLGLPIIRCPGKEFAAIENKPTERPAYLGVALKAVT